MAENVNGSPTMKGTDNPGKLNTSMWESGNAFKTDDKPKKSGKKKKKRGKLANMWENKIAEDKKNAEQNAYKPKKRTSRKFKKPIASVINGDNNDSSNNKNNDTTTQTNGDSKPKIATIEENPEALQAKSEPNGDTDTTPEEEKPKVEEKQTEKPKNKVAALAGKLNFNPSAMKGGLPPSLKKKREEQKEKGVELPEQSFTRPVIPSSARRKATKKNIISITNEQINESLRAYLSESFIFDECMIISSDNLCSYLRDIAGIDLSSTGDNKWELDLLLSATKQVFGDKVENSYGYALRAI